MKTFDLKTPLLKDGMLNHRLLDPESGLKKLAIAKARRHLLDFTVYTNPNYQVNWHHKIICQYLERWAFGDIRRLMVFLPPGSGKALEIHTPIPTPSGWSEIKDLKPGDQVFDENGKICNVVAISPIWKKRKTYNIKIDRNSDNIIADESHIWKISLWGNKEKLWITKDLAKRTSNRKPSIRINAPLEIKEKPLSIHPYVLGVWLGDGCSGHATITQGTQDINFIRSEIESFGYKTSDRSTLNTFGILKLVSQLKKLNLIQNKHIPIEYLRGSSTQRLLLLQGLIDTDGYISPHGEIEFCNINKDIAYGVQELVRSLGCKASIIVSKAKLNGRIISNCYKVHFFMEKAARLPRKLLKCRSANKYINHNIIVAPTNDTNDTICIQVDSLSGMFLCGRSMIPTHNSELVSRRLPAWIFGRNPEVGIMLTSYAASLASDMNIDIQKIIDSDLYREVFPATTLSGKNSRGSLVGSSTPRNRNDFGIVGHNGYFKCAGVGGSITGKRFFYGIIDDPMKGREFAESETIRNKTFNWYNNDFYTRQLDFSNARILITLTRWHEDDLAGRLLKLSESNPKAEKWTVLKFPMIAEDPLEPEDPRKVGESLWPYRYGDYDQIEEIKLTAGTYGWSSLYQQRPSPAGGSIFNRGWFGDPINTGSGRSQFYQEDPLIKAISMDRIVMSYDCTFKELKDNDFVVGQIWGKKGGDFFLLDQSRDRRDIINTIQNIRTLTGKWPLATAKLIEDKANGPAVITMLKREIPGLIAIEPHGSKVSRAMAVAPYVESGNVWLPMPKYAPWLHDFLEELAAFPSVKHDDQVDAMTQAINYLSTAASFELPKMPKKVIRVGGGWNG